MNRRRFLQSLAAVFSLPAASAIPLQPAAAAIPSAAAVPTQARFWAVYMSALHGECTPKTLQNLLHIPEMDAKRYVSQLIADGVIKPNPLLQRTVSNVLEARDENLLDKAKKRLEMKAEGEGGISHKYELTETADTLEGEAELSELVDGQDPTDAETQVAEDETVEENQQSIDDPDAADVKDV